GVQGLVTGSAAGDQADLVPGSLPARDEAVLLVQLELQRIAEHESFERFGDQGLGIVDDAATHGLSFPEGRGSGPEGRGASSAAGSQVWGGGRMRRRLGCPSPRGGAGGRRAAVRRA